MNLREYLAKRSIGRVTVGEYYLIKSYELNIVDDPFKRGAKKPQVILNTDKGLFYAPSGLAEAINRTTTEEGEKAAEEMMKGQIMRGSTYHSKNLDKDVITLEVADNVPDEAIVV